MRRQVNEELLEIRQKFKTFYDEQLRGNYVKLEEKRQVYLKSLYRRLGGLFLYIILYVCMCVFNAQLREFLLIDDVLGVAFVIGLFLGIYAWQPVSNYKSDTKKSVMNKILSFWGNLKYYSFPCSQLGVDVLQKSMLFDSFNTRYHDDCFEGIYNGVKIVVSEQKLTDVCGYGKNKREYSVFKGVLISFDLAKKFKGHTVVRKRWGINGDNIGEMIISLLKKSEFWFLAFFLGMIICFGLPISILPLIFCICILFLPTFVRCLVMRWKKRQLRGVNLEDVVFDKYWRVQAADQIEARYVLTPAFIERMLEVKRRFYGKKIEFSFWNNKVLIAIYTNKDMFETTSLFTPALSYHKVQDVLSQFWAVFSVIDVLMKAEPQDK